MGNNNYLIPANSKKSMLILGFFNVTDLIIFGTGCVVTFILLLTVKSSTLTEALLTLIPALTCSFLVVPVPNQHNIRTLIANIYSYYTQRRTFFWKGWCGSYGENSSK